METISTSFQLSILCFQQLHSSLIIIATNFRSDSWSPQISQNLRFIGIDLEGETPLSFLYLTSNDSRNSDLQGIVCKSRSRYPTTKADHDILLWSEAITMAKHNVVGVNGNAPKRRSIRHIAGLLITQPRLSFPFNL
ncbi:hypothetical protein SNK03_009628 [Fusarium graminearum]